MVSLELTGKKEPISLLYVLFGNYLLCAGPALIGYRMKNGKEFYVGLALSLASVLLFIGSFADPCNKSCISHFPQGAIHIASAYCISCPGATMQLALIAASAISWLYAMARLAAIYFGKEAEIRLI